MSFNPLLRGVGILTYGSLSSYWRLFMCFNPLLRGVGILTIDKSVGQTGGSSFNPLLRGVGILTKCRTDHHQCIGKFQSPSSGRGYSYWQATQNAMPTATVSFNPLLRGVGILTVVLIIIGVTIYSFQSPSSGRGYSYTPKWLLPLCGIGIVSIPFFGAWVFLPSL